MQWTATRPDSLALATAFDGNIVDALTKLGALGPLEETPEGYYSNQNQDFRLEVDGILTNFDATYGHYASSIDVNTGLFVAEDNYSPKEMIKNNGGKYRAGQMPPSLDNWADVTYLQWLQAATDLGGKPRDINARLPNLKYFARFHIINTESQGIINHALKNVGEQLGPWPGRSFSMRTDEGKAILGSPNGRGVAFFLYQHKDLLGIKTVGSVTVFSTTGKDPKGNDETWYQAVFILRNL
ncbi:hypothetical protein BGW36DRAFT_423532 [Talaromyces proteolyticus]|uniref:Uncharacterized protein n=1 Tax=Talaromyces proteolyticus TaxID=1131652 RepID=A0AAD4Q579_9EURO|nr:uncharacterized protein BGW36DRAFT_423532 [Talaromyces proteolyticus]KAH8704001.1 hypothetical protein BGW36DRAFT_423532 [Talaromyces proteolyticus]